MKKSAIITALIIGAALNLCAQPLDDIAWRTVAPDKPVLGYDLPNERDIFWQKRIWRVVDVREKINLPFVYPDAPFFEILTKAALNGDLQLYSAETDDFSIPLSPEDLTAALVRLDTVTVWPDESHFELQVIETRVFYEDIKRFRIKEMWYFDSKSSQLRVRILGIAPMKEMYTESGDFIGEAPLFWVHYPSAREALARETVFSEGNEASRMTWEDLFEMRRFSSYIFKDGNVRDNRLQDLYTGVDVLLEADKIKQEIFNYEHDLWSY
ncbi:MAG: gliding motility protein GldN [Bacteroidetes bacterium]|nr:gliding motility protein GldN [Bacteroidota bacterium]